MASEIKRFAAGLWGQPRKPFADLMKSQPRRKAQARDILREVLGIGLLVGVEVFKNDFETVRSRVEQQQKALPDKSKPKRLRAGQKTEPITHECLAMYLDQKGRQPRVDWSPMVKKMRHLYPPFSSNKAVRELVMNRVLKLHQRMKEERDAEQ